MSANVGVFFSVYHGRSRWTWEADDSARVGEPRPRCSVELLPACGSHRVVVQSDAGSMVLAAESRRTCLFTTRPQHAHNAPSEFDHARQSAERHTGRGPLLGLCG